MLPTEDAAWVSRELGRRFGVPYWSFTLTATDANRFAIRWARHITGRTKVLVHNHCYHGTVDETFAELNDAGAVIDQPGTRGRRCRCARRRGWSRSTTSTASSASSRTEMSRSSVRTRAHEHRDRVAGAAYWDGVRERCDRTGTLLLIDETHTISAGPGGATRRGTCGPTS